MVTDLPVMTYSIYKLTFAPYMEELIPGKLSKAKLKKLVSCVFDAINSDIHYETGSHKPVQPDETAVKDSQKWLAYTKVERESLDCHIECKVKAERTMVTHLGNMLKSEVGTDEECLVKSFMRRYQQEHPQPDH